MVHTHKYTLHVHAQSHNTHPSKMLTRVHTRIVHAGMHTHTQSHKNKPTHRNYLIVGIS